jgi:low affinity Fe/Cu permease
VRGIDAASEAFTIFGTDMTKRRNGKTAAAASASANVQSQANLDSGGNQPKNGSRTAQLFARIATRASHLAGKPLTFLIAVAVVLAWAVSGPFFGFSDTWQLVINTSTTIITFLMVFLIQNTQNRDALAVQLKLSELIIAIHGAKNRLAAIEDLTEEELEQLHKTYRKRAEEALGHLERRRSGKLKQAS